MRHRLASCAIALLCASTAYSQTISVPPDSPRWDLQGKAEVADYLGRKCLLLDGGAAILKDFEMRDAVIDVDVATPAVRGFFGFQFRLADEGANGEWVYLRQHKSGYPDAMQYTPILNTGANWQIYNGEGFTGNVDIPKGEWFHLRLVVTGAQAKLYVKDMEKPALVMDDLKSGVQKGEFALHDLIGATYFSNFEIRTTPDAPWQRHIPAMPAGMLTKWQISPSYDALAKNVERPLTTAESAAIQWQNVEAEPPGFVVLYRYLQAPHLRVTFATDFTKRLEPQPGTQLVYARTTIDSRSRPGEEARDRLQRRGQRVPEREDPLPWPQRAELPGSGVPRDRQPGERHAVPAAEEGGERAGARGRGARRRVGVHLPAGGRRQIGLARRSPGGRRFDWRIRRS